MDDQENSALNQRIEKLEREVRDIRLALTHLTGESKPEPSASPESRMEPVADPRPPVREPVLRDEQVGEGNVVPPPAPIPPQNNVIKEFTPKPSRTREEWETLIGGKLLNRIGALALILGMGFFMKYAFDNNWISETVRVLIGGIIGVLLLLGAWRFHRKGLPIFAQGLLGAGIAILYLSVYASYNFYHLVPLAASFLLMSAVTAASIWQGLKYDSFAVMLLGWCGGFLTPFLLASGESNEAGLFTYIALLDVGLLGVLYRKPAWASLEMLTLLATYGVYFLWFGNYYTAGSLPLTIPFLIFFWGLFFALDLSRILRPVSFHPELRYMVHTLNALFFFIGLCFIVNQAHPAWTAQVIVSLGAVYFLAFLWANRHHADGDESPSRLVLTTVSLLAIATGIQFFGFLGSSPYEKTDSLLPAVAFLLLFWGLFHGLDIADIRKPEPSHQASRHLVFTFNAAYLFFALFNMVNTSHPGGKVVSTLAIGVVYFLTLLWAKRRSATGEITSARLALTAAVLLVIATYVQFSGFMLVIAWSVEAAALVWCGVYGKISPVWKAALALFGMAVMLLYMLQSTAESLLGYSFLLNERALAFGVLAASLGAAVFPLRRKEEEETGGIRGILQFCWSVVLFILCTLETHGQLTGRPAPVYLSFMALCWMVYALPMAWCGLRSKAEPVIHCGFAAAVLASATGIVAGLLTFSPIRDFRLLLNPRAAILVGIMAGVYFLVLQLMKPGKDFTWISTLRRVLPIALVFLAFSLLTGETKDFFAKSIAFAQQGAGADMFSNLNRLENLRQISLSAVWLAYSILLIGLGMWRRMQSLRMIAIALFGVTILKVFLYDLSFLDTLYRIFSFIGLGIILLGVSYVYQRYKSVIFQASSSGE